MPPNNARLNELLEQVRAEFDTQIRQSDGFEHQSMYSAARPPNLHTNFVRLELVSAQVSEMQLVREKVYSMEQTHMTLKQKYVLGARKRLWKRQLQLHHQSAANQFAADTRKKSPCSVINSRPLAKAPLPLVCPVLPSTPALLNHPPSLPATVSSAASWLVVTSKV